MENQENSDSSTEKLEQQIDEIDNNKDQNNNLTNEQNVNVENVIERKSVPESITITDRNKILDTVILSDFEMKSNDGLNEVPKTTLDELVIKNEIQQAKEDMNSKAA